MTRDEVLGHLRATGALMEGHFVLSSGLHSPVYVQCARLLAEPARAEAVCRALADRVKAELGRDTLDLVASPALGGVVVGYEVARQLGLRAIFTERVDGVMELRRGFEIAAGTRVLLVEDVVTTGRSSRECIARVEAEGGRVVAAACLIDRSAGAADLGVPLVPLVVYPAPAYPADALPPELAALPAVKPGSRGLA